MSKPENYRIVFFRDSRNGNVEEHIVIRGTYLDALREIEKLKQVESITYISRYYPVEARFVADYLNQKLDIQSAYSAVATETFFK